MSYAVFLLCLVLAGTAHSESSTETPAADGVSGPPKENTATSLKPFMLKDDNSTGADLPEEMDEGDPSDLNHAESQNTFKFSPADAKSAKQWSQPIVDVQEGDGDDDNDETADLIKELTSLVSTGQKLMESTSNDSDTSVTKIKEEEGDNDEEGEDDDIPSDDDDDEAETSDTKPEESQIKRQDDPDFNQKASSLNFEQPNRKGEIPAPPQDDYVTINVQPDDSNSENDNSPLLQLTQGGYRPPFMFNTDSPRVRAQSASQQSETVENPSGNANNEQFSQPQMPSQVSYSEPFQTQFGFGSALGLRHPFIPPDSFVNSNGMVHQPVQNGFFNVPPAGFTDFSGTNFQAPFSPSNDGGFQVLSRNPGGVSLFQTPSEHVTQHPSFMLQNQQFPQTQFLAADPSQSTPTLYQTTGFGNYPGSENTNAAPRPDYSPFFRSHPQNNLQFQVNNNPFVPPRTAAGILYNPMMQFQPNFPNRPQYSPQYVPNQQVQVQTTVPEDTKPTDSDKITEGETTKSEEQVDASSNKEGIPPAPFGARIQRQKNTEPQSDFPPQADVYMRYPVKDAGYATEESLPVQNTTTKTETKSNPLPPRQTFAFFPSPGHLGDPYRNALNSIQRGLVADSSVAGKDNSNGTKQDESEQSPPRIPFPFSQPAMVRPGYPDSRNSNPLLIRTPSFFRTPDNTAADPFDQFSMFPDQFQAPMQAGSQSQDTSALPACVHGQANASVCFEDPEYPKRDVLFALNSDPYLMDRFSMPDQQLDTISLVEQDSLEHPESPSNYICNSKIRYGFPLRAKDVNGQWKVIINIEKAVGQGRFVQPVRLEVCKGAGDQCNFTQVKTACVQKYNLHRLLSWSPEKGVHNDVFKLPVACSCQLIDAQT